jgi:hypothetical protein
MVAGDDTLEFNVASSFVHDRPYSEHDTGSVETDNLQGAGPIEPVVNIDDSGAAPLSITQSSQQPLAPVTVSTSSLPDVGEDGPAMIDISIFTTAKILDKRSSSFGVEYRCQLEPLWLPADLVKKAQRGRVHIRIHENGLIRAGRLGTLREQTQNRKLSQM